MPHDQTVSNPNIDNRKHYFRPAKFYCVEIVCALCGVAIAWTKFDRPKFLTKILKFLEDIFSTEDFKPSYICIDKACQVCAQQLSIETLTQFGQIPDLLLTFITTTITRDLMIFANPDAIQPLTMISIQIISILLLLNTIKMVSFKQNKHSIHKPMNN
jgi:hypothetical protein